MAGTNPLGQPFPCDEPGCNVACQRRADLDRHKRHKHYGQKIFCPVAGCNHKGAKRHYIYRKHLLDKHPDKSLASLEIPAEDCWHQTTPGPLVSPTQPMPIAAQTSTWNDFSTFESPDSTSVLEYQFPDQAANSYGGQEYPAPDLTTTMSASEPASNIQASIQSIDQQRLSLEAYGMPVVSLFNRSPNSLADHVFYSSDDFVVYSGVFQPVYASRTGTN